MVSSQRVIVALFLSIPVLTLFIPQKSASQVVLEVGPTKVNLKEYEEFYMRNSGGWEVAKQSTQADRERFLELLTNYNLKLLDARDRNLAHDSEIVRELQDYRMSLSSTFMLDRELTEPALRKMYDRRKEELRVQRILVSLRPEATIEESTKAYAKAAELIKRARSGENFDSLAAKNSEIPSAKTDGGDLYYITGGTMNVPFENAAYAMKQGQVSDVPVRTPFGYEIIKVNDRKPVRGKVKVRHLMAIFKTMNPDSAEDKAAYGRIVAMQDSLKKGWAFTDVAMKFSEDVGSGPNGGDLGPPFSRARWVLPFDEVCFKLNVGEVSGIVRTPLGYHIIRCDSAYPLASYEEMKDELKQLYQKYRYQQDYNELLVKLKHDYNFNFIEPVFELVASELDSTSTVGDSAWDGKLSKDIRGLTMFMMRNKPVLVDSVMDALGRRPEFRGTQLRRGELRKKIDLLAEGFILAEKAKTLESRYPEFAALMKEYNDGIILYKAEQLEVWSKSSVSDSALKKFYAENTEKFMLPEQVNIAEIDVASDTLGALLYDSLMHGANFAKLSKRHNTDEELKDKGGERGMLPVTTDEITKMSIGMEIGKVSEPIEIGNGGYTIIKVLKREPARPKTFEEAGAEVSNLYQEQRSKDLEREWLDRLKQKYPVKQYKEELSKAFSNPPAEKAL